MEKLNNFITLREASQMSGYNPDYLSSLIRSGKIKGQKVGNSWMTRQEDLNNYFKKVNPKLVPRQYLSRGFKIGFFLVALLLVLTFVVFSIYIFIYGSGYQAAQKNLNIPASTTQNQDIFN